MTDIMYYNQDFTQDQHLDNPYEDKQAKQAWL